ncbi:MAG: HAMP domain-containing sensor histidine kinase [Nakamurella sp.]
MTRQPMTLRNRVALTALVVLALWVVVLTVGVNVVLGMRLAAQADGALRTRAQAAASTVQVGSDGGFTIRDTADDTAVDNGTWIFRAGQLVEEPAGGRRLRPIAQGLTDRGQVFLTTDGSAGSRWYAEPVRSDGVQVGSVVTLMSLAPYGSTERVVLVATVVLAVLLLGGAYLALRAGVGLALRPVDEMTGQAARWSADDGDRRFGTGSRPVELEVLASTLDGVLDRIAAVLRHERHFSAEISHELRTPLSRLSTDLELLERRADLPADVAATVAAMATDADELAAILETLLTTARQQHGVPGRCDAEEVVRSLAARWTPAPQVRRGDGPVVVGVASAVLQRVLIPVLDNAARYAESAVVVRIRGQRGHVRIEIADDGPGITGVDPLDVFEPGRRGHAHDDHPGSGLGLSLARRLAVAADGTISATSSPRGATFTLTLPSG